MKFIDQIAAMMGGTKAAQVTATSLGVGASAFVVTALARAIAQQKDMTSNYVGVDIARDLNTTSSSPLVSDKLYKDVKKSVGTDKQNQISKQGASMADYMAYGAPIAAGLFGAGLGYKIIDNYYDSKVRNDLDARQKKLYDLYNKLVMARALNAREKLSEDMYRDIIREVKPLTDKTANVKLPDISPSIGLVLMVAAGLGAYGAYNYMAANNPNRLKYKAIKSGLRQYAMQNSMMRPIEHQLTNDPEIKVMLENMSGDTNKSTDVTETPMGLAEVTI